MKHEDYVSFEQAQRLKELGFDWKVRACYRQKLILDEDSHYFTEPKFVHNDTMRKRWTTNYNDNRCGGCTGMCFCSAPTLSQAQKWLYEKFGLWIEIIFEIKKESFEYNIFNKVDNIKKSFFNPWVKIIYDTPEEALSAGIDKTLEILNPSDS